ncbi:hypothetical protein [Companilactobacillus mishanensis]|uniref:Uncharacterized protein n=1 Tax=Companilactobacillus mishanensis TaxID=2486008 RepID=A0ABW9P9M5_9LACO|nr:hypothetical protein [Companilactobacillus mishanensis]MQS46009.1 hypothetical protein [Companilactobacillus mishanensis]
MEETTYYSAMKKDELAIPWTSDEGQVLDIIKQDGNALLMSMTGKENESSSKWVEHGMIQTYTQESLDEYIDTQSDSNFYLDNAFTLMDSLDKKSNNAKAPYVSAIYLASALAQKMKLPYKMTWVLYIAAAYGVGFLPKISVNEFEIQNWDQMDYAFIDKLAEETHDAPVYDKNKVTVIFRPDGNQFYFRTSQAFQDIMELLKLNSSGFEFGTLQIKHSYELIHMAFELSKFYPKE